MKIHRSLAPAFAGFALVLGVAASSQLRAETYVLALYETEEQVASRSDPARAPAYWQSFSDFGRELEAAGLIRGGGAFDVPAVRHVSAVGLTSTSSTKRVDPALSGYFVIEASSLDDALRWAARAPNVARGGTVSVFPLVKSPAMN